ncbi:MAG TPA: integrase arm-type DNA-binding domain-containing protein [Rhodanobacteraceae bacterium]
MFAMKDIGKLTVLAARNACVGKHFDGGGLYLEVLPSGSRIWRLKYRHGGKESRATFGHFPEVSLAEARRRRDEARAHLRDGTAPNAAKAAKVETDKRAAGASFPIVAAAWMKKMECDWADATRRKAAYVVAQYLTPKLRHTSIATLTTKQAADALRSIPPSLAVKARGYLGQIVAYAMQEGLREDGRVLSLRGALPKADKGHVPAAVDVAEVRVLVRAVAAYPIHVTRAALTAAMLTAQRPGTIARMEWAEVDLDAGEWVIPGPKMKMKQAHVVPLSRQAVETLRGMLPYSAGRQFVFPALYRQKTPHLHREALSNALRKMGFQGKHATHGFRSTFRTMARERLGIAADVLEAQLAHAKKDAIQQAYDRAAFVAERKEVMQAWADYLDKLRENRNVIPLRAGAPESQPVRQGAKNRA